LAKTGYAFAGWNNKADGNGTNYAPGDTFSIGEANVTLYARWTIKSYTVIFNPQGGNEIPAQTIKYGDTAVTPTVPTKQSYIFDGWFKEAVCTNPWVFANEKIFTNDTLCAGWVIKDVDENIYTEVKIGNQVWMVENLKVTKYRDKISIPKMSETHDWLPGYCWYNNDSATYKNPYGAFYNWYVVNPTNSRKVAPEGWHVPSDAEWTEL
jgi:uncharacterized repeat protein (TIGR02543 family)